MDLKMSNYKSAQGQDKWINKYIFKNMKNGYFVELGALDGITNSNTYFFEKELKWKGCLIEGNKKLWSEIKKHREAMALHRCIFDGGDVIFSGPNKKGNGGIISDDINNCLTEKDLASAIRVKTLTIEQALDLVNARCIIDYFSLDIEGAEEVIIETFPFDRYTVKVFTIERATEKINKILSNLGYILARKQWPDHYFILKEIAEENGVEGLSFSEFKTKKLENGRIILDD